MATFEGNPPANALTGAETIPVVQGGVHKRTTTGEIAALAKSQAVRTATASDTAVLGDNGNVVQMDVATANTFTVPSSASVAIPIGASLEVWQIGTGQTTIAAGSGVTITVNAASTLKLRGQYSGASLRKVAIDTWRLIGDLEAV